MMNELYLIPDFNQIEDSVRLSRLYGAHFEYNDFFNPSLLDDEKWVKKRIDFYKKLDRDRSRDMLHGSFVECALRRTFLMGESP